MYDEFEEQLSKNIMWLDTANAPGGIMVYYADGDEEIIHTNQYVIEMCSCSTFDEFMEFTGGTFRGFVHEDEIERIETTIWKQVEERMGFDHVFYHITSKSGRIISIDDYGRLVKSENERPIFYVFLAEVDRQEAHDWLTGLPELAHFKHLAALETLSLRSGDPYPNILVFDLMGMKSFNAMYGREAGDVMLRAFADILRTHFGSDACCRHAGDRFFAFAPGEGTTTKVQNVFDDFANSGIEGVLPVMAGACTFIPGDDVSTVLDRARLACDSDSSTWESHLTWFDDDMRSESELRVYVLEHLNQAIENRWLRPYYQPIMRTSTERVSCEEALARWEDPKYGLLSPGLFIPVLEKAGLLHKLDMHMVDCVLQDFAEKIRTGTPVTPVSVNISLRDFGELDIAQVITRKVKDTGISPRLLKIEFTESVATNNPVQLREQIEAFHKEGFSVWADDFGSGYSSFNTLGQFDFDLLKLDMELIRNLKNDRTRSIVEGIVKLARRLGIGTLAEGVETYEQAMFLRSTGCGLMQGYYYSKPNPLETIIRNAAEGHGLSREVLSEYEYWNTISLFDLENPIANSDDWKYDDNHVIDFPASIVERRGDVWNIVRMNDAYLSFFTQMGILDEDDPWGSTRTETPDIDPDFARSVQRARETGEWVPVGGSAEYGTGLQFFTKHLVSTDDADAYVTASVSAMLGTALGSYGDVPVAYAVFKVILDESGEGLEDMNFVYANSEYCDFVGIDSKTELPGMSYMEVVGEHGRLWLQHCYRAAILKEKVHGVIRVPELGHVFSFNAAPASVEKCCSFVFTVADDVS